MMLPSGPSEFVKKRLEDLRPSLGSNPLALDVAMGSGRNSVELVRHGFRVFGVDRNHDRLKVARDQILGCGGQAEIWVADLEVSPLPKCYFDLVICSRYLQRTLWQGLRHAVVPGGFVLYETFTIFQRRYDWGPRAEEHLLASGELQQAFSGWDVWAYEERTTPAAEASLLARRPDSSLI
tara:strand:+ start:213 stop:752 length:540 start_codon:yes stop_codon:yes gene_type:complete